MLLQAARGSAIACTMATLLLTSPAQSEAGCLDWLFGGCCGSNNCYSPGYAAYYPSYQTSYRPLFGGCGPTCNTGCNPCATNTCNPCATQTVSYVPQTCYRSECVNVPVTTYHQVQSCDPCTGCPVTCLRPVTSCVRQVRYVPYTTYRPVCTTGCAPTTSYYGSPAWSAPATSGACCTPSSVPTYGSPANVVPSLPSTSQPVIENGAPRSTYETSPATPEASLKPLPDRNINGTQRSVNPQRLFVEPQNRTASVPATPSFRTASTTGTDVIPALHTEAAKPSLTKIDDGGWRAARR